jgi:hypothetical protein
VVHGPRRTSGSPVGAQRRRTSMMRREGGSLRVPQHPGDGHVG